MRVDRKPPTDKWLGKAYDVRDVHLIFLTVDPKRDAYRSDARLAALSNDAGFTSKGRSVAELRALQ